MSEIPRVAYVITDSGTGGAERKLTDILTHIDRTAAVPVGVVVLKKKRETAIEWEKAGVPVFELGFGRWPRPGNTAKLRAKLKELSADVVHSMTLRSVLLSRATHKRTTDFKLVSAPCLNFRSMPFFVHWLLRSGRDWDDAVICESTATREFLVENLRHDPKKALYVPNSIDAERFSNNKTTRARIRKEWGIGENEILVGTVGRLHRQKGFDVFIAALKELHDFPVKLRGVIVGEGEEEKRLKGLADGLPVLFPGKQSDMVGVLSAFDVYVQSSRYEGMSRALMEAMAANRPIVATAVDGTMDLARDGENMLLCRPDDAHSLALGIGTLAEKSDLRKKLSSGARSTVEQFSVDKMVRRLEKIYQER